MKWTTIFIPSIAWGSVVGPALAQAPSPAPEAVLVTASRAPAGLRTDLLGSSYTVIEPIDLELRQVSVLSDALRDVPGVAVNRTGTVGGTTQVRLRGAESNHTYVMIDGIEASDPFQGEFDFATLLADETVKVEVLRGQQSALYGSNAIGGVIDVITLSGAEAPGIRARLEGGSFDTASGALRAGGVSGPLDYVLSAAAMRTGGTIGARNGIRHAGADNAQLSTKLIYSLSDHLHVTAVGRLSVAGAETTPQDFGSPFGPDYGLTYDRLRTAPNVQVQDSTSQTSVYGLVRADLDLFGGRWTQALTVQGVAGDRKNYDDAAALASESYGSRAKASYVTSVKFGDDAILHTLTFAADVKRETYQNKPVGTPSPINDPRRLDNIGLVGQYDMNFGDDIGIGAAIRYDDNTHFRNAATYRLQASYRPFAFLRLRAAAGSGITNPTNFELFGFDPRSFVGNPSLKPERSEGWETGADYSFLAGAASIGVTYFNNRLKDEIFTAFTPAFLSTPENLASSSREQGTEVWTSARWGEHWRLDVNWTNLHAVEGDPPQMEVRRPVNIASANLSWRAADDGFGVDLTLRYNGEQRDFRFVPQQPFSLRVPMKAYTLINLGADYRLNEIWQIYGRIENLLDQKYEEVFAFPAPGVAAYAGLRARFP